MTSREIVSTSLNDTVGELYREFISRLDGQSIRCKLAKYIHKPSLFLTFMHNRLALRFKRMYAQVMFGRKMHSFPPSYMNEFTPTTRTYPDVRIAVYTIITGGYDELKTPAYVDGEIDYYAVTDSRIKSANLRTGGGGHYHTACS